MLGPAAAASERSDRGRKKAMLMPNPVRIIVRNGGPYVVDGPADVLDSNGQPRVSAKPGIVLCRCGGSAQKPFCDGTHRRNGFGGGPAMAAGADADAAGG
jgi:CDGSH-type Zn-finger protein